MKGFGFGSGWKTKVGLRNVVSVFTVWGGSAKLKLER